MSRESLRVLIVDDSALFRVMIRDALRELPNISIVGSAKNGIEALQQVAELDPDVLTLDVEMPELNGLDVLRQLKLRGVRTRTIMVSRHTAAGAQVTTDALLEGAFDFILKPNSGNVETNRGVLRDSLARIFHAIDESICAPMDDRRLAPSQDTAISAAGNSACELVLIGSSTGGPDALRQILPALPEDFPCPVLVVQHMPPGYTASLARRLNEVCPLNVTEATEGARIQPGEILIAPGGRQMGIAVSLGLSVIRLTDDPPEHSCRPSVDYLFRSAFEAAPQLRMLGVILTGMGVDGTEGCALLKDCGGRILAQHADGCVVYGMPKSVIQRGLSDCVVPLPKIAAAICKAAVKR